MACTLKNYASTEIIALVDGNPFAGGYGEREIGRNISDLKGHSIRSRCKADVETWASTVGIDLSADSGDDALDSAQCSQLNFALRWYCAFKYGRHALDMVPKEKSSQDDYAKNERAKRTVSLELKKVTTWGDKLNAEFLKSLDTDSKPTGREYDFKGFGTTIVTTGPNEAGNINDVTIRDVEAPTP